MAESSTPSGAEQYRIVDELLIEQSNTDTQEGYCYLLSTSWIFMWMDHVAHVDKLLYNPGKLRTTGDLTCAFSKTIGEFLNLDGSNCTTWFRNMWVREPIWCKWVQWYGVDDGDVLDRRMRSSTSDCGYWPSTPTGISLKGDMGARVGHTSKVFNVEEKCGYIELQLRRIFGVTHDAETQLWVLYENTRNPLVLDRGKELMHYITLQVRYYIGFLSLVFSRKLM